jgi:hypothetical protein
LKKLRADENDSLKLLERWRTEAEQAGHQINRIAVAFEAGHASESSAARPVSLLGAALFQWVNPKGWLVAVGAAGTYLQGTARACSPRFAVVIDPYGSPCRQMQQPLQDRSHKPMMPQ